MPRTVGKRNLSASEPLPRKKQCPGNLTVNGYWGNGTSSTNHGYLCGGDGRLTTIDKTAFASDGNSTDVGDPVSSTTNTGSCGLNF